MPKLTRKQTGSKSTKNITGRLSRKVGRRLLNPWGGPNIPQRGRGRSGVSGSSSKQSSPAPELSPQTRGYPRNKPGEWPVEIDFENHTRQPSVSGLNNNTSASHNSAVENAYKRAVYR